MDEQLCKTQQILRFYNEVVQSFPDLPARLPVSLTILLNPVAVKNSTLVLLAAR
jgi:hypothetical protein